MFRITSIHAYLAVDENDEEGVPAMQVGDILMPLIAADERRLDNIKTMANHLRIATGQELKLVKFTQREDVSEIPNPRDKQ